MFEVKQGTWNPAGRTNRWRFGMVWSGLIIGGLGVAVILFPEIIAYAIGGVLVLIGVMLIVSALTARRPAGGTPPWSQDDGDVTVVVETVNEE